MSSSEPYTPEVSGFYGPGPIWAWRVAVLSTTLTNAIRMHLRKRVDTNILIAEAFTVISYPLIASFDLVLKLSRHPYDWDAVRSVITNTLDMIFGFWFHPLLRDPKLSFSARSQAANLLLPLNIIDSFLPFAFLAFLTLKTSDRVPFSHSTKRTLALLLSVSFTWCFMVEISTAARITGLHPNGERYMGIFESFGMHLLIGGRLAWVFGLYAMPQFLLRPLLIVPVIYGLVSESFLFLKALISWDHETPRGVRTHALQFFSHVFSLVYLPTLLPAALLNILSSAWIPEFPYFGLMLGDLDQAAALGVAVFLALYSLCDTLGWNFSKRGVDVEYSYLDDLENFGRRD
ncbi:hypothetical protein CEP54_009945 [Fusarium duplospermum]|uniref:Uncharacterized protein n=1 Tax=Fusarium duplospermum TaxID=1325734 RepID=A0A428PMQ7_9HYPO|nr:hypothetical protein CEP54_009945 [Fusarium duplospermum]